MLGAVAHSETGEAIMGEVAHGEKGEATPFKIHDGPTHDGGEKA